jgi:hypothetical protein
MWVILANTRRLLFEVNVDGDWLNIVERIVLVEGKTKVTFIVHPRSWLVLLGTLWVILSRAN